MSAVPDPNADRARQFAGRFNAEEERDFQIRWARQSRRKFSPKLSEQTLDALAALDERLGVHGADRGSDAIGFFAAGR